MSIDKRTLLPRKWTMIGLLCGAFLLSRILFLDSDITVPFNLALYTPIDEGFYAIPAFNLYHYGELDHRPIPESKTEFQPVSLFMNVVAWGTLRIFGNTYYGLRMASVVLGFGVFLFMFLVLRKDEGGGEPFRNWVLSAWMVYLLCDFTFLLAGRVVEPTVSRMFAMVALMYLTTVCRVTTWPRALGLGFACMGAVVFVYPHNVFILVAFAAFVFLCGMREWRWISAGLLAAYGGGALLCLGCFSVLLERAYNMSLVGLYQELRGTLGDRVHLDLPLRGMMKYVVVNSYTNLKQILTVNIFRFSPAFLLVFLLAMPVYAVRLLRERRPLDVLTMSLLICLIGQSLLFTDHLPRKLIMLLPLVMVIVVGASCYLPRFWSLVAARKWSLLILACYSAAVVWIAFRLYGKVAFRTPICPHIETLNVTVLAIVVVLAGTVSLWVNSPVRRLWVQCCLAAALLAPNLYMSYVYVYRNPTFTCRDAMKELAPMLDGVMTTGNASFAMRLYNRSIPVLDQYMYNYQKESRDQYHRLVDQAMKDGTVAYTLGYVYSADYIRERNLELVKSLEIALPPDVCFPVEVYQYRRDVR